MIVLGFMFYVYPEISFLHASEICVSSDPFSFHLPYSIEGPSKSESILIGLACDTPAPTNILKLQLFILF